MTLIDKILDKVKSKADAAEVFVLTTETTSCEWSSDKLKIAEAKESRGVALRVLIDGKIGYVYFLNCPDLVTTGTHLGNNVFNYSCFPRFF